MSLGLVYDFIKSKESHCFLYPRGSGTWTKPISPAPKRERTPPHIHTNTHINHMYMGKQTSVVFTNIVSQTVCSVSIALLTVFNKRFNSRKLCIYGFSCMPSQNCEVGISSGARALKRKHLYV